MGLEMDRVQRWFVGVALPLLFLGATVVPLLVLGGDLPSPLAVHFDAGGAANGSMSLPAHLLLISAFTVPSAAMLLWAAWRSSSRLGFEAAIAAFLGWLLGMLNVLVMLANHGEDRWQDVTLGAGAAWGATFSAMGVALPVALMVRAGRPATDPPAVPAPLAQGERVAWFGGTRSVPLAVISAALVAMGALWLVNLRGEGPVLGAALLAAGMAALAVLSVDVAITGEGVRVRSGAIGWPSVSLPLADIEAARVIEFRGLQRQQGRRWAGWGYRGSLRLFGSAGWVLRDGPALELDLVGDRRFTVTVDHAGEAASIVNGLLARAGRNPT